MVKVNVSRCMNTQHPDNANIPFFSDSPVIEAEAEIKEAYYAFSHLGCREQMWDIEGKEADDYVVRKLLTRYEDYFRKHILGKDRFLTLRVPNPSVEKEEAKVLIETLESIPRSFDVARKFYDGESAAPVFEVILPMTSSAKELGMVYSYYRDFVAGKERKRLNGLTIGEWIGSFDPDTIMVTPLIEAKEHLLNSADIMKEYLQGKDLDYQRVFLARSDPALNYSSLAAVLMNKIALQRLFNISRQPEA